MRSNVGGGVHHGLTTTNEGQHMSTTVFLEVTLKDGATEIESIIRETLAQTAAFDGNEGLEVVIDDADPTKCVVIERWATSAQHDAYVAWRATPDGRNRLGEILAAPPVTRTFEKSISL